MKLDDMKSPLLFMLLLFLNLNGFSQNENVSKIQLKKNVVYATAGIGGISVLNCNYERMLNQPKENKFFTSYILKFGSGIWEEFFGDKGINYSTGLTTLTGHKNAHLELHLGFTILSEEAFSPINYFSYKKSSPTVNVGFRYQKPNGKFILRTGISHPDYLYLSFGVAF